VFGDERANGASLPTLVASLWGDGWLWLAALVGYLACFASINIYLQGFARLIWSLADEGKLPSALAARNGQGVPATALTWVVAACALATLVAWWQATSMASLIRYANGVFVLIYLLSMLSGVVLLRGGWRGMALLATLLCALVLCMLGMDTVYALSILAILMVLGWLRRAPAPGDVPPA